MSHLAIVTTEAQSSLPGKDPHAAPPPSPARAELAAALAREREIDGQIAELEGALARCKSFAVAVTTAQAALDELEKSHAETVRQWAASGASGAPPTRDDWAVAEAQAALHKAETAARAAEDGMGVIRSQLEPHLAARAANGTKIGALVRQIVMEAAAKILDEITELERERAMRRARVAGLMHSLYLQGLRNDTEATNLATQLRNRLAADVKDTTDEECRAASSIWADFSARLRADPHCVLEAKPET
jgi:hypothetical protein